MHLHSNSTYTNTPQNCIVRTFRLFVSFQYQIRSSSVMQLVYKSVCLYSSCWEVDSSFISTLHSSLVFTLSSATTLDIESFRDVWIDNRGAASRKKIKHLTATPFRGPFISVAMGIYTEFRVGISERAKWTVWLQARLFVWTESLMKWSHDSLAGIVTWLQVRRLGTGVWFLTGARYFSLLYRVPRGHLSPAKVDVKQTAHSYLVRKMRIRRASSVCMASFLIKQTENATFSVLWPAVANCLCFLLIILKAGATRFRGGRSVFRISVGTGGFSLKVQTGCGVHQACYSTGAGR